MPNFGEADSEPAEDYFTRSWVNRTLNYVSSEELRQEVTQMQYIPTVEELPYDALEIESGYKIPLFITKAAAIEDIERLFYILENGYAGYGYFDAREGFQEAKDGIIEELDQKIILTSDDLSEIIFNHLEFLRDCHLQIGDQIYGPHLDFWYDTGFDFYKDERGYLFSSEDTIYNVVSIDGESPDGYMFPSINSDGELVYRLGYLSYTKPQSLEITAQGNGEMRQWEIEPFNTQPAYSDLYVEKRVGGVPVVRIRTFSDHHNEYIRQFLDAASQYKDEPCLIVDIRGNGGGNTAYARQWITRYTGLQPTMVQIFTELKSETSMMGRSNYFVNLLDRYPELQDQGYQAKVEEFRGYAEEMEDTESYWTSYIVPEPKTISNNRTLILLVDKNVGSAAEGFLSYIHQVENVILIGENSAGAVIYGQMTYHVLPHSKLPVYLPISLNVFVDLVYRETRGFYPDLWVPSGEALNYAVAAVRSGSIPTPQWYQEEIASTDFIPETVLESSGKDFDILDYIPVLFAIFYGGILVYANRHRDSKVFFVGGILAFLLVLFFPFKQVFIGYVFLLVGLEYLGIALYKWRKRNRQKSHPVKNQGADEYL